MGSIKQMTRDKVNTSLFTMTMLASFACGFSIPREPPTPPTIDSMYIIRPGDDVRGLIDAWGLYCAAKVGGNAIAVKWSDGKSTFFITKPVKNAFTFSEQYDDRSLFTIYGYGCHFKNINIMLGYHQYHADAWENENDE